MIVTDLHKQEYDENTAHYLGLVPEGELLDLMQKHMLFCIEFFSKIPEDKWAYRYAPNKWSVQEVLQHMIDTERIFAYRALRFARNDQSHLPGFEVDDYVSPAKVHLRPVKDMIEEYRFLKMSNIQFFKSLDREMLLRSGMASGYEISVRAIGFKLIGHEIHHTKVLVERYLD